MSDHLGSSWRCPTLYVMIQATLTLSQLHYTNTSTLSESNDLSILINTTPEHVSNNSAPENRLVNDTLNVLRLNPTIPDPLPSERMLLPIRHKLPRGDIDDDVPRKLVPANMANQPNPRRHLLIPPLTTVALTLRHLRRRNPPSLLATLINHNRPPQNTNPNPLKPPLKLIPQHGPHNAAPHIPPAMPANQNQHLLHVPDPVQQQPVGVLARQPVPVDGRQAPVVHLVQLLREQVALCERLDAVEADARHVHSSMPSEAELLHREKKNKNNEKIAVRKTYIAILPPAAKQLLQIRREVIPAVLLLDPRHPPSGIAGVAAHSHVGDGHVGTSSNGGGGADGLLACGLDFDFGEDDGDAEDDQKLTLVVKGRCCCCCRCRVGNDDVDDDTDGDEMIAARCPRVRRGAALAIECIMSRWICD
ncbi:hypothetical protein Landi51_02299 [Colletotrichum acutatum]